jgi:histidinol-phosphatase (PHP family)
MSWFNFHTHGQFCDGKGTPREYIEEALNQNMLALGFSSHGPMPLPIKWVMQNAKLPDYLSELRSLKNEYRNQIPIYIGLEIDYIPGVIGTNSKSIRELNLDYTIGAIHFAGLDNSYMPWQIDSNAQVFEKGLREIYNGNIRELVEKYYSLISAMATDEKPDIIAHLDLIKKNNPNEKYFSEEESWYRDAVAGALKSISEAGNIIEVNTGGLTRKRCDALYPSNWILEIIRDMKIPITLSADAHQPSFLTAGFEDAAGVLLDIGFKELSFFNGESWQSRSFNKGGLL